VAGLCSRNSSLQVLIFLRIEERVTGGMKSKGQIRETGRQAKEKGEGEMQNRKRKRQRVKTRTDMIKIGMKKRIVGAGTTRKRSKNLERQAEGREGVE